MIQSLWPPPTLRMSLASASRSIPHLTDNLGAYFSENTKLWQWKEDSLTEAARDRFTAAHPVCAVPSRQSFFTHISPVPWTIISVQNMAVYGIWFGTEMLEKGQKSWPQ